MLNLDETQEILNRLVCELPPGIYQRLNGGVILSPDTKRHPGQPGLYVMGEYVNDPHGLGRYVLIYHGSFLAACRGFTRAQFEKKLKTVLHHELTHHLESLAGDRTLEIEDSRFLEQYRDRQGRTP